MNFIIILLTLLFLVSTYFCIKFALIILKVQENMEKSLDIIDDKYNKISSILDIPVFYDSPEIKKIVKDLEETRSALLYIANILTSEFLEIDEDDDIGKESLNDQQNKEEEEK